MQLLYRSSNTCLAAILKRLAQVLANMLCCAKWLLFAFAPTYMLSSIHHTAPWNYFGDNTRQAGTTHDIYSAQYTTACYLPTQKNTGDLCNVSLAQPPTLIQNITFTLCSAAYYGQFLLQTQWYLANLNKEACLFLHLSDNTWCCTTVRQL